jgi:ABC-2 type transport system permease protein
MFATVTTKTVRDRWKGTVIGSLTLGLLLIFGMSVYRDIDLSVYTSLPEAMRAMMNIPVDADVGSIAYGAIYGSYGALTLAGLAIAAGSASIAGEERNGTLGLLLGNPKSRTHVLASKATALVILTAVGAALMWGAGVVAPELLSVDITGIHVGALMIHMFVNAVFYGFLAIAIGGWTGSGPLASGVSAGVMVFSFIAVGLLPVVSGVEDLAKAMPWYYFNGGQPVVNGVDWGHLGVLLAGAVVLSVVAVVGVRRRDLKSQTVRVSLLDRLREHALTQKAADRLAGSTRVSRIWVKTASEHQGLLFITAATMFLLMGVLLGPMYSIIDEQMLTAFDDFPEALLAVFGGGDMSTPEGWYQLETFGMMAPIAVMVVTVAIGARALAGEEARGTMGMLLSNPISRSTVVLEKTVAMALSGFIVGFSIFAGVAIGSMLGGLGMSVANIAATSILVTLLGVAFGALALALSAGVGRVKVAVFVPIGAALAFHVVASFLPLSDSLAGYAKWSPFYYYLSSDPLMNGMPWGHAAVLAVLSTVLIGIAVLLFDRRDLRQSG